MAESGNRDPVHIHTTPDDWSDPVESSPKGASSYMHEKSESGHRARDNAYERVKGQSPIIRVLAFIAGIACIIIGIPMLICPGPGLLVLGVGVGLLTAALGMKSRDTQANG